jgi:16S rRNA (cytidine1402-2'-O)-methyltransferase
MSTLYLVGTPIGNLEDISLRALRILGEVSLIAAEDTRTTGRLLKHFDIQTPMVSYHEYSGPGRVAELLNTLERDAVALVSEAGMPGLSDPGYVLVKAAIEAGIRVEPVPGASAPVAALVSSGLPTDKFLFLGFLPRQQNGRRAALAEAAPLPVTLVLFEAPHRLLALLEDIEELLGDRKLCVGREMTKLHEEMWRGRVSAAREYFGRGKVRGELTLVIAGASAKQGKWSADAVQVALAAEMANGLARKEAAAIVAGRSGWRKRDIYNLSVKESLEES